MKTVLFIDKSERVLWSSFLRYDFLFNDYLNDGLFDVCGWHPNGTSVASAIPELFAVLDDEEEWTAVVVADLRDGSARQECDRHFDNVFDFPENYDVQAVEPLEESDRPLIRLTQMLGGIPDKVRVEDLGAEGNGKVYDEAFTAYSVKQERGDRYFDHLRRYRLGLPRPQRIVCVSPRDVDHDIERMRLSETEPIGDVDELDFWQRNDYPACARFVVYDRMASCARSDGGDGVVASQDRRDKEWFEFWMGVLTLVTAKIPSEHLQAYKVYRLMVGLDERLLEGALSRQYSEWLAARERICQQQEKECARFSVSEYSLSDMPSCETHIPVVFDMVEEEDLRSDASEIGLVKDRPVRDRSVWQRQKSRIFDAFRELLRAPKRALSNAASQYRASSRLPDEALEYCILNEYQCDKLEDELREHEYRLASETGNQAFVFEAYQDRFEAESDRLVERIDERIPLKRLLCSCAVAASALCIGFVPYCLGLTGGVGASLAAVGVTATCCALMLVTAFAVVWYLRHILRKAYKDFNTVMDGILDRLHADATRLSQRVSSYATFRKSWSILERQDRRNELSAQSVWLGRQDALLQVRMNDIQAIVPGCQVDGKRYGEVKREGWESLSRRLQDESYFNIGHFQLRERPLNEGHGSCIGVMVPFEFITKVSLEPLAIRQGGFPCE